MGITTAFGIIQLIEAEIPTIETIYQDFKASGKTVAQYVADIEARDKSATAAAQAEIVADGGTAQ